MPCIDTGLEGGGVRENDWYEFWDVTEYRFELAGTDDFRLGLAEGERFVLISWKVALVGETTGDVELRWSFGGSMRREDRLVSSSSVKLPRPSMLLHLPDGVLNVDLPYSTSSPPTLE